MEFLSLAAAAVVILVYGMTVNRRSREGLDPLFFTSVWWWLWLLVATTGAYGLDPMSPAVVSLFSLMVASLAAGGFFARAAGMQANRFLPLTGSNDGPSKLILFGVLLTAPLILYYAWKARRFWGTYSESADIRYVLLHGDNNPIFGSAFARNLFRMVSCVPLTIGAIVTICALAIYGRKWASLACVVATMLYQSIEGGRFMVYQVATALAFAVLCKAGTGGFGDLWRRYRTSVVVGMLLALAYVIGVSVARGHGAFGASDIFRSFVHYHAGFGALFEQAWQDPESVLNRGPFYGRCSAYGLEQTALFALRRLVPGYVPEWINAESEYIYTYRTVGEYNGMPIGMNSYFSTLYPLWADGGLVLTVLFPLVTGYLMAYNTHRWRVERDYRGMWWALYWGLFWTSSLFQSPLQRETSVLAAVGLWILGRVHVPGRDPSPVRKPVTHVTRGEGARLLPA